CSPACVLTTIRLPSTPWICPITGTTWGCCAEAVVTANAVATAAAVRMRAMFMLFLPWNGTSLNDTLDDTRRKRAAGHLRPGGPDCGMTQRRLRTADRRPCRR